MPDTIQRKAQLKWAPEEDEVILREWNAASRPNGRAQWGFTQTLAALFPHRTESSLKGRLQTLARVGLITRKRTPTFYRPLRLSDGQAGWLAGILDGEGSIRKLTTSRRYGHMRNGFVIQIALCYNTDIAIIEKVRALVPSARLTCVQRQNRKPIYHVVLSGFAAIEDYLVVILPHITHTEKRVRAEYMLDFIRGRKRGG